MPNRTHKSQIDRIRESALFMTVGDDNDGAITDLVNVADQDLYVIKEHSIYRAILADQIDPKRTNAHLPNSNQRIAYTGSSSEIVSRSFLTADALFNDSQSQFDPAFDRKPIMDLCLEIMMELLAAQKILAEFVSAKASAKEELGQPKDRQITIPSIDNLAGQIKAYLQRVEHTTQAIFRLTQIFYDHYKKMFDGFAEKIKSEYGDTDEFSKFAGELAKFMVFIRNVRHCIEHPKPTQELVIRDFSLNAKGQISDPSVEIIHDETPQQEMAVSDFMQQVSEGVLTVTESLMVHLAAKHMKPLGGFEVAVGTISEDQRASNSLVRFGYLIHKGDGWHRLG